MNESTEQQQAVDTADATPAPSVADTIGAAWDALNAPPEESAPEAVETDAPAGEEQPRGADGRFQAREPEVQEAAETSPEAAEQPAYPEYVAPYAQEFERRGIPVNVGVANLLNTWQRLEAQPEQTLQWLARQYGYDVVRPGQAQPQAQQQPAQSDNDEWTDPAILALRQEVAALRERDANRERMQQQAQAAAYEQAAQAVSQEIEAFAKSKAQTDGIDFNSLRPTMAALISSGQANDLADAYEKAIWTNPTTRAARIEAERKQADAKRAEEDAKNAAAARRAGQINVRSDTAAPAKGRTAAETIAMAADAVYGRA